MIAMASMLLRIRFSMTCSTWIGIGQNRRHLRLEPDDDADLVERGFRPHQVETALKICAMSTLADTGLVAAQKLARAADDLAGAQRLLHRLVDQGLRGDGSVRSSAPPALSTASQARA